MKVCLVHDDIVQRGGAESLFATIAEIFPEAPIYTSLVDWDKIPSNLDKDRIITSFIQKIPYAKFFYKALLPLYPLAFESFDFSKFDLVISSTTRFAKAVITKPTTVHISYVNSIPRFLWDDEKQENYLHPAFRFLLSPVLIWLKRWDKVASSRVDYFIANSQNIRGKIKKAYNRDSQVIYPFAATNFFTGAKVHSWTLKSQNYYLIVSRLVKWKKIDLAVKVALDLGLNLKIVGTGPDEKRLEDIAKSQKLASLRVRSGPKAKSQIEFLGRVDINQLRELYRNCRALIVTQDEDFGIAAVEAQACGVPTIAYSASGVKEIIKDGGTGVLFTAQTQDSLKDAIAKASKLKWSIAVIRQSALKFSKSNFVKSFKNQVEEYAKNKP